MGPGLQFSICSVIFVSKDNLLAFYYKDFFLFQGEQLSESRERQEYCFNGKGH